MTKHRPYSKVEDVPITPEAPAGTTASQTGTLTRLLGRLMDRISTITGKAWYLDPDYNLKSLFGFTMQGRNSILVGGGDISFGVSAANKLTWSAALLLQPVPDEVAPDNFVSIGTVPSSGVLDDTGAERASATGITLNDGDELWLTHTLGASSGSANTLRVVTAATPLSQTFFGTPAAYLLAVREASSDTVYLRNGVAVGVGATRYKGGASSSLVNGVATVQASNGVPFRVTNMANTGAGVAIGSSNFMRFSDAEGDEQAYIGVDASGNLEMGVGTAGRTLEYMDNGVLRRLYHEGNHQEIWLVKRVATATTVNITLSGSQSVGGVGVVDGMRVLVKNQTSAAENGIYAASTTGAWTRVSDLNEAFEFASGIIVLNTNDGVAYRMAVPSPFTLETSSVTFTRWPPGPSTTEEGLVELATAAETETGTDGTRASTPSGTRAATNNLAYKADVRVATTANINLATGGLLTVDGVTLIAGNRVLVKNQTSAPENGIYLVASGAWTRAADADSSADFAFGQSMRVLEGSQAGVWYMSSANPVTVGTTSITYTTQSSSAAHAFWGNQHTDVTFGDTPANGEVPTYDSATSKWLSSIPWYPDPTFITGMTLQYLNTTQVNISSGACWIPAEGKVMEVTATNTLSPSLSANTRYYIYAFNNSGSLGYEVTTTAPSLYRGSARQGGTGGARRYIGTILTNASANILRFEHDGEFYAYLAPTNVTPFRVLTSTATGTAAVQLSLASIIPPTTQKARGLLGINSASVITLGTSASIDVRTITSVGSMANNSLTLDLYTDTGQQMWYRGDLAGSDLNIEVVGFYEAR